ncbi:MAG: DUF4058 family protein [Anaerolineae bacterium]|nr:MAG: DUF4058 family protein [Anaerolineae bacterium]
MSSFRCPRRFAKPAWRFACANAARVCNREAPEEIRETCLEIRPVGQDRVVTVIELLSSTNKRPGTGRRLYEKSGWPSSARAPTWPRSTCCAPASRCR